MSACLVLAIVILTAAYVVFYSTRKKGVYERFFNSIGGTRPTGVVTRRVLESSGRPVSAEFIPASRLGPGYFYLLAHVSAPWKFSIKARDNGDALLNKLGLGTAAESGDKDFDSRFRIESNSKDLLLSYFASPKKKEAVAALFAEGCSEVKLDKSGLRADWSPFGIKDGTSPDFIARAQEPLAALAGEFPATEAKAGPGLRERVSAAEGVFALIIAVLLVTYGQTMWGQPIDCNGLLLHSLIFSVPLFIACLAGLAWLRLERSANWYISRIMLGFITLVLAGYWAGVQLNSLLDNSPAVAHQAPVLGKRISGGKSKKFYVIVNSWRAGNRVEALDVSKTDYDRVDPGDIAVVETKSGRLGYEFITSLRFVSRH